MKYTILQISVPTANLPDLPRECIFAIIAANDEF